ncbi:MAG: outer membrane beta-barrel protein, partial [Sphingomonadales bacterium]
MRTSVLSRAIRGSCLTLFFTFSGLPVQGIGTALAQEDYTEEEAEAIPADNGSTISYGPDFFAQHPNAITALDIIRRIPAGNTILNSGDSGNRGFSSNDDRILINGKRLSGKSNDSQSALGRITIDKIARIDVIRGSSPDVKVSSQESILNIILKDGAGDGGSGSWRFDAEVKHGPQVAFGGFLSYGGSLGSFDYFVSLESDPQNRQTIQNELFFDGMSAFTSQLDEVIDRGARSNKFAGNFGYTFKGGQTLRLNALYEDLDFTDINSGILSDPDGMGGLIFAGNSTRFEFRPRSTIEIGGDFEADFSDVLRLKIIALYSVKDQGVTQSEDFLIEGPMPVDDFVFIDDSEATENIGRASLTWQAAPAHSLEFGLETAINELDVNLVFLENDGSGNLVPVDIPGSQVLIKEVRNEPFFIHSWKMNGKINIDTALVIESFRISQNGVDVNVENSFFFLRPSIDFRYNITDRDQFQISIRRRINQLDFRDFAASASDDDDVIGANADLTPEKLWTLETSYEHRLANDGGRVKLSFEFERRGDRIERI